MRSSLGSPYRNGRRAIRQVSLAALIVAVAAAASATPALAAHPNAPIRYDAPAGYLSTIWREDSDPINQCIGCPDVRWYFAPDFPGWSGWGGRQNRTSDSFAEWGSHFSQVPLKLHASTSSVAVGAHPADVDLPNACNAPTGYIAAVHWPYFASPGFLAKTNLCLVVDEDTLHGQRIVSAAFSIDSARADWHAGSSGAIGPNEYDFQSTITQEIGHSLGWWPPAGDDGNGHLAYPFQLSTLCAATGGTPVSTQQSMCSGAHPGTIVKRSLGVHDLSATHEGYLNSCPLCN